jgi:soluble P-type ATPase
MSENRPLEINIPGRAPLKINYLILDYNGTIACDGELLEELIPQLTNLAQQLRIHIVTADTHGCVAQQVGAFPHTLEIIGATDQAQAKQNYLHRLGAKNCIAIGNGANDALMLRDAALGFAIMHHEGAASASIIAADVTIGSCHSALDLLLKPARLIATLRC